MKHEVAVVSHADHHGWLLLWDMSHEATQAGMVREIPAEWAWPQQLWAGRMKWSTFSEVTAGELPTAYT